MTATVEEGTAPPAAVDEAPGGGRAGRRPLTRTARFVLVTVALAALLVGLVTVSAALGQFPVTPPEILASIARRLGLAPAGPQSGFVDGALWNIRFPRIVLGLLVGAALGVSGALMQGVFRNPLAEPGVIGVSAGAAVGACLVIVLGLETLGSATVPAAAFGFGLVTTLLVYVFAMTGGRTQVLTLVLTGIAVNAVANAAIAYMVFLADRASREQIIFWQLGSLNGASWSAVVTTLPFLVVGTVAAVLLARPLDLLALGEGPARHLGVNVERLRIVAILCVALLAAAAVAFAGIISFVGLVIPHLLRILVGPSHRLLIPASALGGAVLIAAADLAARTAVPFADLPIGMFTALVGGPVFFLLLRRMISPRRSTR